MRPTVTEVIQVGNAELALQRLESELPDIIVLDNHLPGMTGNEFCREIRLNVNTRAIPVLMLTAEKSDAAQMQGLASGADDYVVKSVDPDILRVARPRPVAEIGDRPGGSRCGKPLQPRSCSGDRR